MLLPPRLRDQAANFECMAMHFDVVVEFPNFMEFLIPMNNISDVDVTSVAGMHALLSHVLIMMGFIVGGICIHVDLLIATNANVTIIIILIA